MNLNRTVKKITLSIFVKYATDQVFMFTVTIDLHSVCRAVVRNNGKIDIHRDSITIYVNKLPWF